MHLQRFAAFIGMLACGFGLLLPAGTAQENGIFADFRTSMGSFTCRLDYVRAPKAVANFIGLATGTRAWLDNTTGQVRSNAYYSGLTFHRVIKGFMIQGGSANGLGTDDPGYVFPDEFDPNLRHDGPGVLSMANSGPDSNGSQFFITVTNTPWLDNVHTVFGRVTLGQRVVDAISKVTTDAQSKPLTNVVIQSIGIRRVGAGAQAFNCNTQGLPVVTGLPLHICRSSNQAELIFTNRPYADTRLYSSSNLTHWTPTPLGLDLETPVISNVVVAPVTPARFYKLVQTQYPSSTLAPRDVVGRALTLSGSAIGTLSITFTNLTGGAYTWSGGPAGGVTEYTFSQEVYRARLWPIYFTGLVPMTLRLDFISGTNGTFAGTGYTSPTTTISLSGQFTLSRGTR